MTLVDYYVGPKYRALNMENNQLCEINMPPSVSLTPIPKPECIRELEPNNNLFRLICDKIRYTSPIVYRMENQTYIYCEEEVVINETACKCPKKHSP